MNHSRSAGIIALVSSGLFVAAAACSSREGFEDTSPPLATGDSGPPEAAASCIHCSRNLKQVLDGCEDAGEPKVIETCGEDQGCGGGRCVDACTAAALENGSVGCDFWTLPPTTDTPSRGACFTAIVTNTWDRGVTVSAEYDGGPLDISKSIYVARRENEQPVYTRLEGPLPPGEVGLVFLAYKEGSTAVPCPEGVTPALSIDPITHGTALTKAFHIQTDAPVSAYSISPYGGATSFEPTATLLLPVSAWAKNYVAIVPEFDSVDVDGSYPPLVGKRNLQIVASEDDTEVRIKPTVDIEGSVDVPGTPAGVPHSWTLAKGQVLQLAQDSLSGSPIESTKPVGVFGGSHCTFMPAKSAYCDMLQQQIPPLVQWGTQYAVVPYPSRIVGNIPDVPEVVPYTIVGAADGTQLTYEPSRPRGAPETLQHGEVASFTTDAFFVVKSQDSKHPIHVNVYMTGARWNQDIGGSTTTGDPEFVNVPAADQYLDRYVFFADFTYPETGITVVRRKTANGFLPVELTCGGEIPDFQPLGTSGQFEYAWLRLTRGFTEPFAKDGCTNYGRQEAHSDGPFAITVWGTGAFASYGYVGGTGLRPINDAVPEPVR